MVTREPANSGIETIRLVAASKDEAIALAIKYSDRFRIVVRREGRYVLQRRRRNWFWIFLSILVETPVPPPTLDAPSAVVDPQVKNIVIEIDGSVSH